MPQLAIPMCEVVHVDEVHDDASFFAANGYLVVKSAFPPEMIDQLAEFSRNHFRLPDGQWKKGRLTDAWKEVDVVRQVAVYQPILDRLKTLYGREALPFQTLNFGVGTEQATHSDIVHFSSYPQRFMCGVWVALETVNEENGALHYYPGSHRLPIVEAVEAGISGLNVVSGTADIYGPDHNGKYERAIAELVELAQLKKKVVCFEKGDALIWAANLLHGGEPIRKQGVSRHSQVTHYYFENCRLYTPLLSDMTRGYIHYRDTMTNLKTGQPIPIWTSSSLPLPRNWKGGFFARVGRAVDRWIYRARNGCFPMESD